MSYTPHTDTEIKEMLKSIGVNSVTELFGSIPADLRSSVKIDLPKGLSEIALKSELTELSNKNKTTKVGLSFLGAGAYDHFIPAAVSELAGRSEFVTPYTPYQPEISQGTLQAIFEYQSLICRLFEMDISNASHYDCATALTEAVMISLKSGAQRKNILVPQNVHPEYLKILETVLAPAKAEIIKVPTPQGVIDRPVLSKHLNNDTTALVLQFPNFFGIVEDFKNLVADAHNAGALAIAIVPEPISLGILKTPGEWGFDIAVGEGLGLGMPTNFGGPTLGIFTAREKFLRMMPGRICGETLDSKGRKAYVLTMSTREQHIRRAKATSNICSNQALCATTAAIYLSLLGKEGIMELALVNASRARTAMTRLTEIKGIKQKFSAPFFNEFVIDLPIKAKELILALSKKGIHAGVDLGRWFPEMENSLLVCCTEQNSEQDVEELAKEIRTITYGTHTCVPYKV